MVAILPAHQRGEIMDAVRTMYTTVARHPDAAFHFPTGRAAAAGLGYPDPWLDAVPGDALAAFAGVAWPFQADVLRRGDTVLDVGAGSGTDALIAARAVGAGGRVLALDLTTAMVERLAETAAQRGFTNVRGLLGDAEALPLATGSVDVVTSNGALNLVLDKRRAFAEIVRVLRPGGWLQLADVVLGMPVTDACRADPRLWVECVVGATPEAGLRRIMHGAGLRRIEVLQRFDYFAASPSAETREIARALGACSIVVRASRVARSPGR